MEWMQFLKCMETGADWPSGNSGKCQSGRAILFNVGRSDFLKYIHLFLWAIYTFMTDFYRLHNFSMVIILIIIHFKHLAQSATAGLMGTEPFSQNQARHQRECNTS